MGEKITTAVAAVQQDTGPSQLVTRYQRVFDEVLPSHLPVLTFVRLSQGLLRKNDRLREAAIASPESFLAALVECARLGHEPGTDQFALVPFRNSRGVPEVEGIEQYQGEIERMFRAGAVRSVRCEVVRDKDRFLWRPTRMELPEHEFDPLGTDEERGGLHGVYAYAMMADGGISQVVVMGRDEVMRHRAAAKTKEIWDGPFEVSMWRKTAVHELEKWVPTSSEWLRVRLQAAAEAQEAHSRAPLSPEAPAYRPDQLLAARHDHPDTTGELVDAEVVPEPPAMVSPRTLGALNTEFARLGWGGEEKERKLEATEILAGRSLEVDGKRSSRNLTGEEAEAVLRQLRSCTDGASLLLLLDHSEQERKEEPDAGLPG